MNEYIKAWLIKPNGNGVYLTNDLEVVVIYDNGYLSDSIIDYGERFKHRFAGDIYHSATTNAAIETALRYKDKLLQMEAA